MNLSKKDWDNFLYKMIHPNNPLPIDIFCSAMPFILVWREGKNIYVKSDIIDEEEILKNIEDVV